MMTLGRRTRRMSLTLALLAGGLIAGLLTTTATAAPAPTSTLPDPVTHKVWVAAADYRAYPRVDSDAEVNAQVAAALDYWTRESRGVVTFERASSAVAEVAGTPGVCSSVSSTSDAERLTADAAAATGFPGGPANHLIVLLPKSCAHLPDQGAGSLGTAVHEGGWVIARAGSRGTANIIGFLARNLGFGDSYVHGYRQTGYSDAYSMTSEPESSSATGLTTLGTVPRAMLGLLDTVPWQTLDEDTTFRMAQRGDDGAWDETVGVLVEYRGRTYGLDYRAGRGVEKSSFYALTGQYRSSSTSMQYPLGITMTMIDPQSRETALIPSFSRVAGYYANPFNDEGWKPRDGEPGLPIRLGGGTINNEYQELTLRPAPGETMRVKFDLRRAPVLRVVGSPRIGGRLTATLGETVPGRTYRYRWTMDGRVVSRSASLDVTRAHGGSWLLLDVDVLEGNHREFALQESVTVPLGRLTAPTPRIVGKAKVGARLKVATGTWTKGTRLDIHWYVGGKPYGRAVRPTFVVPRQAAGKTIRVQVRGWIPGYAVSERMSRATAKVRRP